MDISAILNILVYPALRDLMGKIEDPVDMVLAPDTVLAGPQATLDSMDLVILIVELETRIEQELGVFVVLANFDQENINSEESPLHTLRSLAGHIQKLIAAVDQ